MPPPVVWELELPDVPLTEADLVGRVLRLTRLNWKPFLRLFVLWAWLNAVAVALLFWISTHLWSGFSQQFIAGVVCLGLLMVVWSRYAIAERTFALQLWLLGQAQDMRSALAQAKSQRFTVLIAAAPVVFLELIETFFSVAYTALFESAIQKTNLLPEGVAEVAGFALWGFSLVLFIPSFAICIFNAVFMAIIIREKISILAAFRRFAVIAWRSAGTFLSYVCIFSLVYFVLVINLTLIEMVELIPEMFEGDLKEQLTIICAAVMTFVLAPLYALWYSSYGVAGATLYQQASIEREGADISAQLEQIKSRNA